MVDNHLHNAVVRNLTEQLSLAWPARPPSPSVTLFVYDELMILRMVELEEVRWVEVAGRAQLTYEQVNLENKRDPVLVFLPLHHTTHPERPSLSQTRAADVKARTRAIGSMPGMWAAILFRQRLLLFVGVGVGAEP